MNYFFNVVAGDYSGKGWLRGQNLWLRPLRQFTRIEIGVDQIVKMNVIDSERVGSFGRVATRGIIGSLIAGPVLAGAAILTSGNNSNITVGFMIDGGEEFMAVMPKQTYLAIEKAKMNTGTSRSYAPAWIADNLFRIVMACVSAIVMFAILHN